MMSSREGEGGGYPNSDAVREVVLFRYYRFVQNADRGEGVKIPKI